MRTLLLALLLAVGAVLTTEATTAPAADVPSDVSTPPVKFGDALNQKFHHPRCLQCHQFNSARHQGRAYNSHSARFLCDRCHSGNITGLRRGEWIAPPERMDWTDLSARDTCMLIKRNLAGDDPATNMLAHLLGDVRVHWALDNGMTPGGRFPAVPGGSPEFAKQAREWVTGGMLCE
ncbi:MAG: hypothetical protein PHD37_17115 [Gallionellaceae bacterium]|nr:hypothetical protein [Gallionellaceae bacterium]